MQLFAFVSLLSYLNPNLKKGNCYEAVCIESVVCECELAAK